MIRPRLPRPDARSARLLLSVLTAVIIATPAAVALGQWRYDGLRAIAQRQWELQLSGNLALTSVVLDRWAYDQRTRARQAAVVIGRQLVVHGTSSASSAPLDAARRQHEIAALWVVDTTGSVLAASTGATPLTDEERTVAAAAARGRTERLLGPSVPIGGAGGR